METGPKILIGLFVLVTFSLIGLELTFPEMPKFEINSHAFAVILFLAVMALLLSLIHI